MFLSVCVCAAASVVAVQDDPVGAAIAAFQIEFRRLSQASVGARERHEALSKAASDAIGGLKIEALPVEGFERLNDERMIMRVSRPVIKRIDERLAVLAKEAGESGARAALLRTTFNPTPTTQDEANWAAFQAAARDRLMAALTHPGLGKAVEAGTAKLLFAGGGIEGDFADAAYCEALTKIARMALSPETAAALWGAYLPLTDELATAAPEAREALRQACAERVAKALSLASTGAGVNARVRQQLEEARTSFNGAFAKGTLLGHAAPEIEFLWSNLPAGEGGGVKKLSELKGKVIVLEFWATWHGPCVEGFGALRELAARYKGYPVVIVGVTDLPGTPRPLTASGRPIEWVAEKQYPALEKWLEERQVTWPVAVGAGNVFNPEYGVTVIPHMVIIDPQGIVRWRGLDPAAEPQTTNRSIDSVLKEFNLPSPGA